MDTAQSFAQLDLSKEMLDNLEKRGYKVMTPIQAEVLPHILKGSDVIAQAKTGSGKTAAFGIGLLQKLDVKKFKPQVLVLCPTRELAHQVAQELRVLAKFTHNIKVLTLCGGEAFGPQVGSLKHGAHIIVGTPGRVLKHLNKEILSLKNLHTLVFDEADRMLDMGFIEEIEQVLAFVPSVRQTLLFSATYTEEVMQISGQVQNNPIEVKVALEETKSDIEEVFYNTSVKKDTLVQIFATYKPSNVIVFTNTKLLADELARELVNVKIDALALHGDLEQFERNDVLVQFANGSCPILIATDVAARGLDIKELAMVVNFEVPFTQEVYTHRIGRTGRAGAKGVAITLYDANENIELFEDDTKIFADTTKLQDAKAFEMKPQNVTLVIEGGKKDKLRAGDILGALTGDVGLTSSAIGKIDIYDRQSYVAIQSSEIDKAYKKLKSSKIKNKKFSIWVL